MDAARTFGSREWLEQFVDRCQGLIVPDDRWAAPDFGATLRRAVDELPSVAPRPDHLLAIGTLAHVLCSVRRRRSADGPVAASVGVRRQHGVRADATDLLDLLLESRPRPPRGRPLPTVTDACVHRALRFVADRFGQPDVTLVSAAQHAGVSRCHLARALKRQTGRTFLGHLHGTRIAAAERLLATTTLNVKEIAALSGYKSPTQLCRYFRRVRGMSPLVYRHIVVHPLAERRRDEPQFLTTHNW